MCKLSLEAVRNNQSFSSNYGEPVSYPLIQQWAVSWSDFFCFYHLSVICNIITSALSSFWILQDGEKWKIGTAPRPLVGGMEEERNLSEGRQKVWEENFLKVKYGKRMSTRWNIRKVLFIKIYFVSYCTYFWQNESIDVTEWTVVVSICHKQEKFHFFCLGNWPASPFSLFGSLNFELCSLVPMPRPRPKLRAQILIQCWISEYFGGSSL